MNKRTTICCPFCRRRMSPHYPEHAPDMKLWLCTKCEIVLRIEQMPWYPKSYIRDNENEKPRREEVTRLRKTKHQCPKGCGRNLTEVITNGIIRGFYCLDCDKEYLPAGYTPRPEEKDAKK